MCVDALGSALADERRFSSQTILTVSNYEYIFAYKLNQSGGIELETRATGILSTVYVSSFGRPWIAFDAYGHVDKGQRYEPIRDRRCARRLGHKSPAHLQRERYISIRRLG